MSTFEFSEEAIARLLAELDRYRLAWMSARQRAMNHLLALVESDDERDALRAALADEQGSHAMTASSFEIFVESSIEHAERHREIFDAHLRQVAELTDERDEARAGVVRLGKALQKAADNQCGCLGTVET